MIILPSRCRFCRLNSLMIFKPASGSESHRVRKGGVFFSIRVGCPSQGGEVARARQAFSGSEQANFAHLAGRLGGRTFRLHIHLDAVILMNEAQALPFKNPIPSGNNQ
jgi:hypothetical protein